MSTAHITKISEAQIVSGAAHRARNALKILLAEFYSSYLSADARERQPSIIRLLFPFERVPGMISLLSGKPNPATFPIKSLSVTVELPGQEGVHKTLDISGPTLRESLEYTPTAGIHSLLKWIAGLQEFSHGRKADEGWRISMGCGAQDLIYKTFQVLLSPGDPILVESPVYSGVIPIFQTLKSEIVSIDIDEHGIKSSSLRSILEQWPPSKPMPKVLYTVPYGCNPTGLTATEERRREVLDLAAKYNFLIMEDDPYYYLYYGKAARPPSYFTLETQLGEVGRVIRFDSLSKILSSGIRIGFVSGPKPILDAIDTLTATANLQVPSLTQSITFGILNEWGYDAFLEHTKMVSEFYRQRCEVFERAMQKHLGGLAEWTTPQAGLFFWFKLLLNTPANPAKGEQDSATLIRTKAFEAGVLALPGEAFMPNAQKSAYVRAAFSCLNDAEIDEALRRLRRVILDARA